MDLTKEDIEEISEKAKAIPFAFFSTENAGKSFKCHFSALSDYEASTEVSIYRLKPLQRIIAKKLDLFTNGLQQELADEDQRIPVIINWENQKRHLLILDLDSSSVSETTTSKIEELKLFFKKMINH